MTYTFDEAEKEINEALDLIDYEDMPNKIYEAFNKLRQEYAPTVEMTEEQKKVFLFYKNTTWFSLFLGKLNDPDNKEFRSLPNLNAFKDWGFQKKRECELMQAWLHPETIKVEGE